MTTSFWRAAAERSIKSAVQAILLVVGAAQFDWLHADWKSLALSALGAAGLSLLTSIASIPYGRVGTPSLVGIMAPTWNDQEELAPVNPVGFASSATSSTPPEGMPS